MDLFESAHSTMPVSSLELTDSEDFLLHNLTSEQTADIIAALNGSMSEKLCSFIEKLKENEHPTPIGGCEASFDGLICWPATKPETTAVTSCLPEIQGISYNTTQNVTRWCYANGTWNITDYSACEELIHTELPEDSQITMTIYFVGYISSLIVLILAVCIFMYFKDLRCLRNVIHTNLMCTYILSDLTWILTLTLQISDDTNMATCVFLMILLHYFSLTNFFWMFVEGLYLYMLVVETFSGENIKLRVYATIGWGFPAIITLIWIIIKVIIPGDISNNEEYNPWEKCPWMQPQPYDWIHQAPSIGILLVNLVFLLVIMWVLITKLRSAQTVETQQYRKAAKALLVLIPLLGTTYVLVLAGPSNGVYGNIYEIIRATMIATQGLTVALFYCFLNTEVQNTLRHHHERWKTERSFRGSRRATFSGHSKDYSPRSRTESMRLYSQPSMHCKKRESSASEITTTTLVNTNGGARVANGAQSRSPFLLPAGTDNV